MTQALLLPETRAALKAAPADARVIWCTVCGWVAITGNAVQGVDSPRCILRGMTGTPAACIAAFQTLNK